MARGELSPPGSPRVPLRRLSTRRFKTLAARNNDNARRRSKYAVTRAAGPGVWAELKANRKPGQSWVDYAPIVAQSLIYHRQWVDSGGDDIPEAKTRFDNRPDDHPIELYYYHGIYG